MEFESIPARIEKMREALRHDFGPDAESDIREIDRAIESEIAKDPLLAYASNLFYKANIRLRQQRIEVARKLQSNGINENLYSLDILLWDSRLVDQTHGRLSARREADRGQTVRAGHEYADAHA